jgi:P27 family predicted phage terminase small subunit
MKGRKPKMGRLKRTGGDPAAKPPMCPGWLSAGAKREWRQLATDMVRQGVLVSWDLALMATYCQLYGDYVEAQKQVNEHGPIIRTPRTGLPMANPFLAVARKAREGLLRTAPELGLSPVARARLQLALAPPIREDDDALGDPPVYDSREVLRALM